MSSVSAVIVAFHSADTIGQCLSSLTPQLPPGSEVLVIDNNSNDGLVQLLEQDWPHVQLISSPSNLGYAGAANLGISASTGDWVLIMNPDTQPRDGALRRLLAAGRPPRVAVVGPRLVDDRGQTQPSARSFPSVWLDFCAITGLASHFPRTGWLNADAGTLNCRSVAMTDWVVGAFFLVRRTALTTVGLFDTRFFLYSEEVDLCYRMKQCGYEVCFEPDAVVVHSGGVSSAHIDPGVVSVKGSTISSWLLRSRFLYYRKHYGFMYAVLSLLVECSFQMLRILVRPAARLKARQSLFDTIRAWTDSQGGAVSPPAPWVLS